MSDLSAKITLTAVDHVSSVVKGIGKEFADLKKSFSGVGAAWGNVSSAGGELFTKLRNLSLAAVGAGAAIFGLAEHYAEMSHQLLLSQSRTGVSAENLQRLGFSAKLSAIDTEKLNTGLRFLNKNIATSNVVSSKGGINLQAKAFKALGVATKDSSHHLRNANDVMLDVADKFHNMRDGAEKTRLAMILFGRAGASYIPWLDQGSAALKKQGDELAKLGHILTGPELKANAEFEESIIKLKTAVGGLASIVASALIPVLQPIVDDMIKWIEVNRDWLAKDIKNDVVALGHAFSQVWAVLKEVGGVLTPIISAFGGLQTIIEGLAGLYIGSLVVSFAKLVYAIYGLGAAFVALDVALAPVIAIGVALGLVGSAIYLLIDNFTLFKSKWDTMWAEVPDAVKKAMQEVASILQSALPSILPTGNILGAKAAFNVGKSIANWINPTDKQQPANSLALPGNSLSTIGGPSSTTQFENNLFKPQQQSMNNAPQKLDINMRIDADGRPSAVKATSSAPITFKANTGKII